MANCPKCNEHLKLTDWKQHCPHCGANLVIYDLQERLMQDADIAEVQYYHFQKKIDRLKASFIGSKLAIVRIITSLLPIGALFLPLIKATLTAPFEEFSGNITVLNLYNSIDQLGNIPALLNGDTKTPTLFLVISIAALLLSVLLILVHFILLTLACSSRGKQRNTVLNILILVTTFASLIAFAAMPDGGAVTGSLGIGAYLYAVLQLVNTGIDFAVL
ncbi:MAG: zinc ribbon domain-containing protein, partial [Clostridia bacterium]|nr:zinc ribbon domain-containing protein [Clostridia bacterium]